MESADAGGLALADSLTALRHLTDASRCNSVEELIAAAVTALMQHQDFDACLVLIKEEGDSQRMQPSVQRGGARMPGFLDALVSAEVVPALMGEGLVFAEQNLENHRHNGHGSLLGVPISDGSRLLGGLMVWNQQAHKLLPWHQNLLEMFASVFGLVWGRLRRTAGVDPALVVAPVRGAPLLPDTDESFESIDHLAGVHDRRTFERLLDALASTPVSGVRARYLLYVDIDRFQLIREYGGEVTAERMVRVFLDLLRREMGQDKLIGRLSTDQFAVLIEHRSMEQVIRMAESLVEVVDSLRLSFFGQRYDVSISVGIAALDGDTGSVSAALRHAMQACRAAQKRGGGAVQFYNEKLALRRRSHSEGRMLNRLTRALKDNDLELYAQHIAPLDDSGSKSESPHAMHELLLRMRDDEGELINAAAFLTVAERYGLSVKLDRWVIQHAFRQIAESRFAHDANHRFALNLSGHSIDDQSLQSFIVQQFEASGLSPQRICFEITETAAISDIGAAKKFVEELKMLGCEFALDDFGSGHSSFLYLRDLPIDYLKIDGELVREIAEDPVSLAFVRTIEGVARLMGRRTIAEFVETEAIRDAITEIGCNFAQGYLVGRPVPLADVLATQNE